MLATPPVAAAVFLIPAIPIAVWVAWNDLAHMKIPNMAVLAALVSFGVLGPFVLPLLDYGWRWTHFALILVAGFLMNMSRLIGAGDAKFAAAMAPFIAVEDAAFVIRLFAAALLAAFIAHRFVRALPQVVALCPGGASWQRAAFPMGFAVGPVLAFDLLAALA